LKGGKREDGGGNAADQKNAKDRFHHLSWTESYEKNSSKSLKSSTFGHLLIIYERDFARPRGGNSISGGYGFHVLKIRRTVGERRGGGVSDEKVSNSSR